jgi:hypothetical protein
VKRGGSFYHDAGNLQVGYVDYDYPFSEIINLGFRFARTQ